MRIKEIRNVLYYPFVAAAFLFVIGIAEPLAVEIFQHFGFSAENWVARMMEFVSEPWFLGLCLVVMGLGAGAFLNGYVLERQSSGAVNLSKITLQYKGSHTPHASNLQNIWSWYSLELQSRSEDGTKKTYCTIIQLVFDKPSHTNYFRYECNDSDVTLVLQYVNARSAIILADRKLENTTVDVTFSVEQVEDGQLKTSPKN